MVTSTDAIMNKLNDLEALMKSARLDRFRETHLGFGRRQTTYLFINQPSQNAVDAKASFYTRDSTTKVNTPIFSSDLTCFVKTLYRRSSKDATGKERLVLEIHLEADKNYVLQTGFRNNAAASLLAAFANLPREALAEPADPITLSLERSVTSRSHPTIFVQVEYKGQRVTRDSNVANNKSLLAYLCTTYGFVNPLNGSTGLEPKDTLLEPARSNQNANRRDLEGEPIRSADQTKNLLTQSLSWNELECE